MYSPAEILHGLIDPQTIVPTLLGAKAVVFDFQSSQDSHAAFSQRIAPDPVLSQVLGHPFEMRLQEPEDFLKGLRMALIPRHLIQGAQRHACLLFVLTVFEDVPETTQEGAQATDLLIGLDDLDQELLFFGTHSLFGLEQQVAVLPQALGQGMEPRLAAQPQALMDILTTGIDCDHQNPVFISSSEGTVGIGFNDFGANRDGDK